MWVNITTPKRWILWLVCFLHTQVYDAYKGCFPLRLDTHGVTIIYVLDIWKGWSDAQCWRQVQNHQNETHQNSYEFLESYQIRPNKIYPIAALYHYISIVYIPHYFPFLYFIIFLILISFFLYNNITLAPEQLED